MCSREATIRPAPQTARQNGNANAAMDAAPPTPCTTDSVAPTKTRPGEHEPQPCYGTPPRGARRQRVEDQHRDRHDNDETELGEGRDPADDAAGREYAGGAEWIPATQRNRQEQDR